MTLYSAVASVALPISWWGRLRVHGADVVPTTGPVLLAPNHDSQMDPLLIGLALSRVRPVRFIGRANLWDIPGLGHVLDGIGAIPIHRGHSDGVAIERAIGALRGGQAVCIFPEGRLSLGQALRARTGLVRIWRGCPEARLVACAVAGATEFVCFPARPRATVRFLEPIGGQPRPEEDPYSLAARVLTDVRALAPPVRAGRGRIMPRRGGRDQPMVTEMRA